jgi:hypothetical protein
MTTFTKVAMMAVLAMGSLQAATMATAKAVIPFPFTVEGRAMPAGEYSLTRMTTGTFILVHNETTRGAAFQAAVQKNEKHAESRLSFRCASEVCEIATIKLRGEATSFNRVFPKLDRSKVAPTTAHVRLLHD